MADISASEPSSEAWNRPRPRPSRWDGRAIKGNTNWIVPCEFGARWGHEWAAVAWMALCVQAAGEKPENVTAWMLSRDPYFHHVGEM